MTRTGFCVLAAVLALAGSCGGSAVVLQPISDYDRAFVAAALNLEGRADELVDAAHFRATHQELRTFGDEAWHRHEKRITELKEWQTSAPATAPVPSLAIPCANGKFELPSGGAASDAALLDALIRHRSCLLALGRDALQKSSNDGVRHLAQHLIEDGTSELDQMNGWRRVWA